MNRLIEKPEAGEFMPYAAMYIDLLPDDGRVLAHLAAQVEKTAAFLRTFSEAKLTTPHAPKEWTTKEIVAHVIDDERIYVYRALRYARNDQGTPLGFDQDLYAMESGANGRSLDDLLAELAAVRLGTVAFFQSVTDEMLRRRGVNSEGSVMSVRAAAYHIAGHELHHLQSIRQNYGT